MSNIFLQYSDIFFGNENIFRSPIFLAKKIDFLHDYAMIESDENGEERILTGAGKRRQGNSCIPHRSGDIQEHNILYFQT